MTAKSYNIDLSKSEFLRLEEHRGLPLEKSDTGQRLADLIKKLLQLHHPLTEELQWEQVCANGAQLVSYSRDDENPILISVHAAIQWEDSLATALLPNLNDADWNWYMLVSPEIQDFENQWIQTLLTSTTLQHLKDWGMAFIRHQKYIIAAVLWGKRT